MIMHQREWKRALVLEKVVDSLDSNSNVTYTKKLGSKTILEYSEISSFLVDFYVSPKDETYELDRLNLMMSNLIKEIEPFEFNPFSIFEQSKRRFLRFGYIEFRDYPAYGKFARIEEITIRDHSLVDDLKERRKEHYDMFKRRLEQKNDGTFEKSMSDGLQIVPFLRKIRLFFYPSAEIANLSLNGKLNPSSMIEMK